MNFQVLVACLLCSLRRRRWPPNGPGGGGGTRAGGVARSSVCCVAYLERPGGGGGQGLVLRRTRTSADISAGPVPQTRRGPERRRGRSTSVCRRLKQRDDGGGPGARLLVEVWAVHWTEAVGMRSKKAGGGGGRDALEEGGGTPPPLQGAQPVPSPDGKCRLQSHL